MNIFSIADMKNQLNILRWNTKTSFIKANNNIAGSYVVLIYHGIVENNPLKFNSRFITRKNFSDQIKLLKKSFNVLSTTDIYIGNLDKNRLNVAISFDDGYKNNYLYAAEILNELNVPATFFITTIQEKGYRYLWTDYLDITTYHAHGQIEIDGNLFTKVKKDFICNGSTLKTWCKNSNWEFKVSMMNALKDYEACLDLPENKDFCELMKTDEILSMSGNSLFTIGSHGLYHNNLEGVSIPEAQDELLTSKHYLEAVTGKSIDLFAYPDGSYNDQLIDLTRNCGYKFQFLVEASKETSEPGPDIFERFGMNPYLHAGNQIKYIKKGNYI